MAGKAPALRQNHLYYFTKWPKQELGNEEKSPWGGRLARRFGSRRLPPNDGGHRPPYNLEL
jgi:hypothetical protein